MKIIVANILLICCFSLIVLPGVATLDNQISAAHCCASDCDTQNTKTNDESHDCTNEVCNPFTHCSCCVGFIASPIIVCSSLISSIPVLNQEKIPFLENLFIESPWQPPKNG